MALLNVQRSSWWRTVASSSTTSRLGMGRFVPFLNRWSAFMAFFVYSSSILDSVKACILAVWAAINVTRIRWRLEDLWLRRELLSESKIPPDSGVPDERRFFQNGV